MSININILLFLSLHLRKSQNILLCDGLRPNKDVSYFAYAEEKLCCLLC